jgi:hypothetical protein
MPAFIGDGMNGSRSSSFSGIRMAGVGMLVSRPLGRSLVVGGAMCRSQSLALLQRLGFTCVEAEEPYAAMREICSRPLAYHSVILSLAGVYPEELAMITTIKKRFGHIEIWLCNTDGRHAALAQAMRCGADGLLAEDGLHRLSEETKNVSDVRRNDEVDEPSTPSAPNGIAESDPPEPGSAQDEEAAPVVESTVIDAGDTRLADHLASPTEPVLTADELRALLQEPSASTMPPPSQRENHQRENLHRENLPRTA